MFVVCSLGLSNYKLQTINYKHEQVIVYKKNRFTFWKVFWVVLAVYIFFVLFGMLATSIVSPSNPTHQWKYFLNKWRVIGQCLYVAGATVFFYFMLNYLHRFFVSRKSFFYYLRLIVIASICLALYQYGKNELVKQLEPQTLTGREMQNLAMEFFSYIMFIVLHASCSLLIAYLTYLRDEKKQRQVLEEQKMQLEVEKSSANLNFLKAQINPHFLHNTLNFLYAKSLPYSPELSEGILTLSDIMRYALSEGNAKDGKAPLKDEIEHVWNVIKINQLRFSNKLNVNFKVQGLVAGVSIIPFVLITIVENAFKHGDLKDQEHPIEISLDVNSNKLRFRCRNKKKSGPKELSTGVGLQNINKRLELAYGSHYQFNVKDEADFYTSELIIDKL